MKHLRKFSLLESNQILSTEQIEFLNECTNGSWSINPETGLVDIEGDFNCYDMRLKSLQGVRFGSVTGSFYCNNNQLVTLEGAPQEVGGNFYCYYNQLVSLEGAPEKVGKSFYCNFNRLVSLEGVPKEIGRDFYCGNNRLVTLEAAPKEIAGNFYCDHNLLVSLEGAPKEVGGDFNCSRNQLVTLEGAPQEVGGYFSCNSNRLVTLEGAPKEVGADFYCNDNQLVTLEGAPQEVTGYFHCNHNQLVSLEGAPKKIGVVFNCPENPVSVESLQLIWNLMKEGNEYSTALLLALSQITNLEDKKLLYDGMDPMSLFKKELGNRTFAPYLDILKDLNIPIPQFSNEEQELMKKLSKGYQILQRK